MKSSHQNSPNICRAAWKTCEVSVQLSYMRGRLQNFCSVCELEAGAEGRSEEGKTCYCILLTLHCFLQANCTKHPKGLLYHWLCFSPISHPSFQYEKHNPYRIQRKIKITQTKSNQREEACKSNGFGSEQHFIKTRDMNCSICVSLASYCSDLLL